MKSLPDRIMGYAESKPEATPIQATDLLHLGDRAAVNRALSRLARSKRLMRICRGLYMRPIQTRFGLRAPSVEMALAALSELWDETIVVNGGDAANWLGLTTQVPVRSVYLTSDPTASCTSGLTRSSFCTLRAGNWWARTETPAWSSGRSHGWVHAGLKRAWTPCCPCSGGGSERASEARASIPTWIAEPLGRRLTHMAAVRSLSVSRSSREKNETPLASGVPIWGLI